MSPWTKLVAICAGVVLLASCAAPPAATPLAGPQLWQDEAFHYVADRVSETRGSLFALDAAALSSLKAADKRSDSMDHRLEHLLSQLYSKHGIRLSYVAGHSTGASQTWNDKRGDCLSLTIMVYAATQSLGIPARMQEVQVPLAVDRHGGIDFINGHVNVYVPAPTSVYVDGRSFNSRGIVIDFDLQPGSRNVGRDLNEDEILARYYNNRATEFLVKKDVDNAYAYYKAALLSDSQFAPGYANLAQLYYRNGLAGPAEQLLRHALALQADSYAPLRGMQEILVAQGRTAEAQVYADRLHRLQDADPYYWLGLGMDALRQAHYGEAIHTLERAAKLSSGFQEVHYHLALAYLRNGQSEKAAKQIAILTSLTHDDPGVAYLNKKMQNLSAKSSFF